MGKKVLQALAVLVISRFVAQFVLPYLFDDLPRGDWAYQGLRDTVHWAGSGDAVFWHVSIIFCGYLLFAMRFLDEDMADINRFGFVFGPTTALLVGAVLRFSDARTPTWVPWGRDPAEVALLVAFTVHGLTACGVWFANRTAFRRAERGYVRIEHRGDRDLGSVVPTDRTLAMQIALLQPREPTPHASNENSLRPATEGRA